MRKELWDVPETLQGVQTVRARIDECVAGGDEVEAAWGALALSRLVKWAPWDENGFQVGRSVPLAEWALEVFRRHDEKTGIANALRASVIFKTQAETRSKLDEAERLAREAGNETELALTWAAKARTPWWNPEEKEDYNQRALEVFRRIGDDLRAATTLFSMGISNQGSEGFDYALESARIFRDLGKHADSARSFSMASHRLPDKNNLRLRRSIADQGSAEARASEKPDLERLFAFEYAEIGVLEGRSDELQAFLEIRRAKELAPEEEPGVFEDNHDERRILRRLRSLAQQHGNIPAVGLLDSELTRLRKLASDRKP